jgi:hypothetical protein
MAEQTLGEALAYAEAATTQETHSDADYQRVVRAGRYEAELLELRRKAQQYGCVNPDKEPLLSVLEFVAVQEQHQHQNSAAINGRRGTLGKSKNGPRNYSVEEKRAAYLEWQRLDRDQTPLTLDDWLDEKFGNRHGHLNVKPSTLYGWKRYLENS